MGTRASEGPIRYRRRLVCSCDWGASSPWQPVLGAVCRMPYAVCCWGEGGWVRVDPEPDAMEGPDQDRGRDGLRHAPSYIMPSAGLDSSFPFAWDGTAVAIRTQNQGQVMLRPSQQTRLVCHGGIIRIGKHAQTIETSHRYGICPDTWEQPWLDRFGGPTMESSLRSMSIHARARDLETGMPMKLRNSKPARAVRLRTGVSRSRTSSRTGWPVVHILAPRLTDRHRNQHATKG